MSFDPKTIRQQLEASAGYDFDLGSSFEEAEAVGGLASSAHAFLNSGLACLLVGLKLPAEQLFNKASNWLRQAIDKDERPSRYFPDGTEALRYSDLAILSWLLSGVHDSDSLGKCIEHTERYLRSPSGRDRVTVLLSLVDYLDAADVDRAYELVQGTRGLKPPASARGAINESQVVHLLKQHGLDSEEGQSVMKAFLHRSMDDWLVNGHYERATKWTKIVYWRRGTSGLSPYEVVLQCYRHLPNVVPLKSDSTT